MYKTYIWGNYEPLQQKARKQCANMPLLDLPCMYSGSKQLVPHFSAGLFSGEADTECLTRLSFHHPASQDNYTYTVYSHLSFKSSLMHGVRVLINIGDSISMAIIMSRTEGILYKDKDHPLLLLDTVQFPFLDTILQLLPTSRHRYTNS